MLPIESVTGMIGPINLDVKQTGKRSAGKPHAAFDVAGAGNVAMATGLRPNAKAREKPPGATVRAPALDPTCEGLRVRFPWATHLKSYCVIPLSDFARPPLPDDLRQSDSAGR